MCAANPLAKREAILKQSVNISNFFTLFFVRMDAMNSMKVRCALVVCLFAVTSMCQATVIDIVNPSFENGTKDVYGECPGWTVFNGSGTHHTEGSLDPHSGTQRGYMNATGKLSQLLTVGGSNLHVAAGDQISFSIYQGRRGDQLQYDESFNIQVWGDATGNLVLGDSGSFGNAATRGWTLREYTYTANLDAVGHDLYVALVNTAYPQPQLNVDDISATYTAATPEPSTLVLAVAGTLSLLCYAWRKRK